jgi:hypothetical protein
MDARSHCYACAVRECAARVRCAACKTGWCACNDALTAAFWRSRAKHKEHTRRAMVAGAKVASDAIDCKIELTKQALLPLTGQSVYERCQARVCVRMQVTYCHITCEVRVRLVLRNLGDQKNPRAADNNYLTTDWYERQALRHDKVVLQLTECRCRVQVKLFIRDEGLDFVPRVRLRLRLRRDCKRVLVKLTMQVTEVRAVTRSTLPTELGKQVVCIMCVDSSGRVRLSLLVPW